MKKLAHLATRIFNTPLLIHPSKMETILRVLGPRLGLADGMLAWDDDDDDDYEPAAAGPGYKVSNGIAYIEVSGTLVKRSSGMDALSGLTSYQDLTSQITSAFADPAVKGIVFDVDSPGGEAAGMSDLSDLIYSLRGQKPTIAVSNDSMYSAAYGIASAADQVYVTRDGGAGSIGCYMLHVDQSEYDKQKGVKFTYIYAGDHKVDGNPHEPLAKDVLVSLQGEVDRCRDMFVNLVARNRNVTPQQILDTQAGLFFAEQALPLLADKVGSLEDAMVELGRQTETAEQPEPSPTPEESLLDFKAVSPGLSAKIRALVGIARNNGGSCEAISPQNLILAVRFFGQKAQSSAAGISGIVAPYGESSIDLGGFKEVYEAGCFSESLTTDDPRILFNHNSDFVLGRKSAGTARFIDGAGGLSYEATPPDTQWAKDLTTSMSRGDITQSSAAFYILKHRWEQRGGQKVRVIEKARLVEASVASFAAYESTQATVQSAPVASHTHEIELAGARLQLLRVR